MDLGGPIGGIISSAIVATLGTWWFAYVLKGLQNLSFQSRMAVYAGIWAAYFFLMMVFIDRLPASG